MSFNEAEVNQLNAFSGFLSYKFTWAFNKFINSPAKLSLLVFGNQSGKCLFLKDFLYTSTGIVRAGDSNKGTTSLSGVTLANDTFEDDVYELTFSTGIKIKCNKEHPFWWKQYGQHGKCEWKTVEEILKLKKNGYVYFSRPEEYELVEEEIKAPKFMGYLCSDGYISNKKQSLKFTNINKTFLNEVEELSKEFKDIICTKRDKGKGQDIFFVRYSRRRNSLREYINELGITKETFGKIQRGDKESLKSFLQGYFNGDGYLLIRKRCSGWSKLPSIEVGFSIGGSERRANEFQYILWRLGIFSQVVSEKMGPKGNIFYRVKVSARSVLDVLDILDWAKYPEKFKEAKEIQLKNKKKYKNKNWISIRNIKYVGKGKVAGITTETNELISYCGMKTHNTGGTAFSYVLRILGQHPVAKKNVVYFECENEHEIAPFKVKEEGICPECKRELTKHERGNRVFRFASQTLPGQSANVSDDGVSAEVKNTQYPEFKKWLPPFLIKKDITFRSPTMIIKDPFEGKDIIVEFVSYNQSVQSTAGTQRISIWMDEAPDFDFYEEQIPRLIAEDGDLVFTYTPVDRSSWLFDEFFEKSSVYYRSKAICDFLNSDSNEKVEQIEYTESTHSIAVFMAATDDNPTLKKEIIDSMFEHISDPDIISIRRYGIFKQLSGRIFKDFDYRIHYLKKEKYFPEEIPYNWVHGRGIDFHPQTPWAVLNMSLSPENELFVWGELNPSPEKFTIREISKMTAVLGEDYRFRVNLIDPLSEATKKDNMTVKADLNAAFRELRREGIGTGAYWESWNTKGEKGRDAVRERLKNARDCKRPSNNKVTRNGKEVYIPTLWVLDSCPIAAKYLKNWRWEEWADSKSRVLKEEKNKPEQRWSHFNMVIEALLKEESFRPKSLGSARRESPSYYNRDNI